MPSLSTSQLRVSIAGKSVCDKLDLELDSGQTLGILGTNGVGKTTLLLTLAGLRPAEAGTIKLFEDDIHSLERRTIAKKLGVLLQHDHDPFPGNVMEAALVGRHPYLKAWQMEGPEDLQRARASLAAVGLADFQQRQLATLSGGERRRLAIATLLTQDPEIMLLDEPTSHLDIHYQIALLNLFRAESRQHHKTIVLVLHDVNLASHYCDKVLLLYGNGEAEYGDTRDILTSNRLCRLYDHPITAIQGADALNNKIFLPDFGAEQ